MALTEIFRAIGESIELLHIVLFAVGIICMVIEMFEPGVGVFGIVGVIVMVIDIFVLADNFVEGLVLFAGLAIIIVAFVLVLIALSSHGILPKSIVLKEATDNENGYTATSKTVLQIGDRGVAVTDLRPSGKAEFGNISADVVSNGAFIVSGTGIAVIEINGNKIVVREDEEK